MPRVTKVDTPVIKPKRGRGRPKGAKVKIKMYVFECGDGCRMETSIKDAEIICGDHKKYMGIVKEVMR